jgi:hypothetical protein
MSDLGDDLARQLRRFRCDLDGLRLVFPEIVVRPQSNRLPLSIKHDLQVTDSHFHEATQNPTQKGTEMGESDGKPAVRPLRENEKTPEFPGLSRPFSSANKWEIPPTGLNCHRISRGI